MEELRTRGLDDVLVFGGGVIPDADIATLKQIGRRRGLHTRLVAEAGICRAGLAETLDETRGSRSSGPVRVPGQAVLRPLRHPRVARRRRRHRRRGGRRRPTRPATRSWSRPRCRSAAGARPAASSSPTTPTRCASTPGTSSAWTSRATSCKRLWVEHASDIAEEYYASFTLDRSAKKHLLMLSARGRCRDRAGRRREPRRHREAPHRPGRRAVARGGPRGRGRRPSSTPTAVDGAADILAKLYRCYVEGDCDLAEINPLILTPDGRVHALDAKVSLDDNAAFRHPEWDEFRGIEELDDREKLAKEKGLQYIGLDGHRRHHRQRRRAGHEHARRRQPGRRSGPPTSSTSAAAPTPT